MKKKGAGKGHSGIRVEKHESKGRALSLNGHVRHACATLAVAPMNFWVVSKYDIRALFRLDSCLDLRLNFAKDTS